jgi:hypothetical protein
VRIRGILASSWKKEDVSPLIKTAKDTDVKKHITQLIKSTSNPRWVRINLI